MNIRNALAALAASLSLSAQATSFSTDATDLWWNASESGWGINVVQQADVLFMTFFLYAPGSEPTWYSASDVRFTFQNGQEVIFTGALYETHGPWFGGDFFVRNVQYRQVGNVTFNLRSPTTATVTYTVDQFTITKDLTRATWRTNDISGFFMGGWVGTYSNCPNAAQNGYFEEQGTLNITQNNGGFNMVSNVLGGKSCTFNGPYRQTGRMGFMTAFYQCNNGAAGSFQASEVDANAQGITARGEISGDGCRWIGRFGGLKKNP